MKLLVLSLGVLAATSLCAESIYLQSEQLVYVEGQTRGSFGAYKPYNMITVRNFDHDSLAFKNPSLSSIQMWRPDLKALFDDMMSLPQVKFDLDVRMVTIRMDNSTVPGHSCYVEKREDVTLTAHDYGYDLKIYGDKRKFFDCTTEEEIPSCAVYKNCR